MNREWDEPISPRGKGEQKTTPKEVIERFVRAIEISKNVLKDADIALQGSDLDEINFCIETLSDSIFNLERKLTLALTVSEDDVTLSTESIDSWRMAQKMKIDERKETLKQLKQSRRALERALAEQEINRKRTLEAEEINRKRTLEAEEINRRRALEEEELTRRRDLEDQERDREIQWIRMRNAAHQNLPKSGKSLDDDIRSSSGDSSPNYGSQFSYDPDIIQRQDSNLQASKVCMPKTSLKIAEVETQAARHTFNPSAESHKKDHAIQLPSSLMQQPSKDANEHFTMAQLRNQMVQLELQMMEMNANQKPPLITRYSNHTNPNPAQTNVKLQRYTITPFKGEYRDWIRFLNQFSIEVDQSGLAEI